MNNLNYRQCSRHTTVDLYLETSLLESPSKTHMPGQMNDDKCKTEPGVGLSAVEDSQSAERQAELEAKVLTERLTLTKYQVLCTCRQLEI